MASKSPDEDGATADDKEELVKPIYKSGVFKSPFDTWKFPSFWDLMGLMKAFRFNDTSGIPLGNQEKLDRTLPIVKPDNEKMQNPPQSGVQVMWIGHASVLVQIDGISVLTDPVFSARCSPLQIYGNKRFRDPPCTIEELPNIDAVVISHNHYDHLDYNSVKALNKRFGSKLCWYVAQGQAQWMKSSGCENVVELSWWDEHRQEKNGKEFVFACTPSQHWCQRTAFDRNKALWCSWVVKGPENSLFFGGDTGYCSAFKQIGKKYGPITFAAIPIGAYCPRWFMKPQHVDPEEAVQVHEDLGAKTSIGIHWGTFKMSVEPYMEPKEKLAEAVKKKGLSADAFYTLYHGEVKQL